MPKKFKAVEGSDGYVYPVTSTDLVVDSENKPITEIFAETNTKLEEHEANIENNANRINNAEERMTAIEVKNEQQDSRLNLIEGKNKVQDIDLKCLFADSKDGTVNISEEGNSVKLQNSRDGYVVVNEIEGNTLVNCNKESDKELILNGNIDTSGDNSITLTEGVNGGLVDVALEGNTLVNVSKTKDATPITHESEDTTGNHIALADEGSMRPVLNGKTMVNVCDQKDPVAITKSYTVETGNHVALQGEYDGKCRPVVTGNTLVNLYDLSYTNVSNQAIIDGNKVKVTTTTNRWSNFFNINYSIIKPNTKYTIIVDIFKNTMSSDDKIFITADAGGSDIYSGCFGTAIILDGGQIGRFVFSRTSKSDFSDVHTLFRSYFDNVSLTEGNEVELSIIILEGDYTDKPIPDYFEGLQSTFEDNLVTQEMVDNGEEVADNLGKYRADYKVTGKNKFYGLVTKEDNWNLIGVNYIDCIPNMIYKAGWFDDEHNNTITTNLNFYDKDYKYISSKAGYVETLSPGNAKYMRPVFSSTNSEATEIKGAIFENEFPAKSSYEPYKEYTKTLYLNSPLLEGDTIEEKDGSIYHVHRYKEIAFDGNEDLSVYNSDNLTNKGLKLFDLSQQGLESFGSNYFRKAKSNKFKCIQGDQNNIKEPFIAYITRDGHLWVSADIDWTKQDMLNYINDCQFVYELPSPQYELIEQSNLTIPSYTNGHLDFDTAVPIEKVEFKNVILENKYLYANTEYTVQFEADGVGKAVISLGGTTLAETSIVKGLNKVNITTPETLTDNNLVLDGIGFNASDIVVTQAIPQDFGYFSGLSSTFEDNLVTQEMVDSGEEVADNLGKYRVDYKVTGKNLLKVTSNQFTKGFNAQGTVANNDYCTDFIPFNIPSAYYCERGRLIAYFENTSLTWCSVIYYNAEKQIVGGGYQSGSSYYKYIAMNSGHSYEEVKYVKISCNNANDLDNMTAYIGKELDCYEDVKSYKKTFYLNSPLLKGDTIEQQGDNVVHVHRSELRVYETGDELTLPTDMTNTLVSKVTPTYEVISQNDSILCDSYTNGHLDVDSVVPIEKVDFLHFEKDLTYLYANTQYAVQFVSDAVSKVDITLGGAKLLNQDVVVGTNKYMITTPSELVHNNLVLNGEGFNASNIVVTEATDQEFGYFEGMKSVGECEDLEVVSCNKNLFDIKNVKLPAVDSNIVTSLEIIDNSIVITNNKYNGWISFIKLENLDKNKTYTISYILNSDTCTFHRIGLYKENGTFENIRKNATGSVVSATFTGCVAIVIQANASVAGTESITNIQLEEGSTATDYIPHASNTQTLTHEPLRAVGDVKDKYVLIDGKWYIERYVGKYIYTGKEPWSPVDDDRTTDTVRTFLALNTPLNAKADGDLNTFKSDKLPNKMYTSSDLGIWIDIHTFITLPRNEVNTVAELKLWLQSNPIIGLYQLRTPQYEPIDYNPFTVYSDVTHISNNSTIPCNMTIKNTGYNCLLKPSTTYTVSSNLGLNTVTTPSVLTEDCLRFYDTDTSTVTTMKNVTILEGDYTTGKPIPSHFSGIESAFEQEYDEEKGKYKVKTRVQNEDASKENYIEFYIDEPLRGIRDVKDKVYVKDDKVVVQRNCGSVTFDGSDDEKWNSGGALKYNNFEVDWSGTSINCICNTLPSVSYVQSNNLFKNKPCLTSQGGAFIIAHVNNFKQWLQQNPTTVVYQLAEPTYEEVEYDGNKLIAESFKDGTLFYNSNVPVSSNINYTFTVPVMDEVNALSTTTDEQDTTIASLAYIQNMQAINSK